MQSAAGRRDPAADAAMAAVRAIRRHELLRIAMADLVGDIDLRRGRRRPDRPHRGDDPGRPRRGRPRGRGARGSSRSAATCSSSAMGSLGGGELGYASDADVMFVHQPHRGRVGDGGPGARDRWSSRSCAGCSPAPGPDPGSASTPTCAPRARPARWCAASTRYRTYYERWAAHLGVPGAAAGHPDRRADPELAEAFIDAHRPAAVARGRPHRQPGPRHPHSQGAGGGERLPRGADPRTHLKLGRGGLTDVEWTVQLHPAPARPRATRRCGPPAPWRGSTRAELGGSSSRPRTPRRSREAWQLGGAHAQRRRAVAGATGRQRSRPTCATPTGSVGSWAGRPARVRRSPSCGAGWRGARSHATDFNFYESPPRGSVVT